MEKISESTYEESNPRQYLEAVVGELELLAIFAKANHKQPVVVLIDGSSPWATQTNLLLAEVNVQTVSVSSDRFLKGLGSWAICEMAARSAPEMAKFILDPPADPSRVKIVMFHQTKEGLRIACSDILPDEPSWH